jgi:S-adenosylmethionine-diacylgycerolhomoserine-N-methlytransferase
MIPDWFAAVDHAVELLKPGGLIGVVDFYVSRKHPEPGRQRHGWFTRSFWPLWFANDNVFLSSEHVPYLHRKFETVQFSEHRARAPYLLGLRVPYYRFVGRRGQAASG